MKSKVIVTENAPAAIGPYSQAIHVGGLLFCSGLLAAPDEAVLGKDEG